MAGKLLLAFRHCPFQLLLLLASTQFGKFLENTAGGNWSKLFEAFAIFVIKRTKPNIGSGILLIVQAMGHRGRGDWWSVGAFGVAFLGEGCDSRVESAASGSWKCQFYCCYCYCYCSSCSCLCCAFTLAVKLLDNWKTAACKSKNNYNCAKF